MQRTGSLQNRPRSVPNRFEGQRCKYAEKSYMYKYDLGHISIVECCCIIVRVVVQSVRERERERSLPPRCNRRVWRERRGQEVVASVFSSTLYSSHIVYLTACGLSWFFPPLWVFHVISCVLTFTLFSEFYFVHTFSVSDVAERTSGRNPNKVVVV